MEIKDVGKGTEKPEGADFTPTYKPDASTKENKPILAAEAVKSHAEIVEELRRDRIPFSGKEQKLSVNGIQIPGYHLYWFNDNEGRIARALEAGYRFVTRSEVTMNTTVAPINNDPGGNVRCAAGGETSGGEPLYTYLMKLPEELWDDDQAGLQQNVDLIDQAIGRGVSKVAFNADAGNESAIDHAYTPTDKATGRPTRIKQTTSFVRPRLNP